jgi:Flp pilus assembly protein TadD
MTDKLNEMWTALAAYQDKAEANTHGDSWSRMCSEKTYRAANSAYLAAYAASSAHESVTEDAALAAQYAYAAVNPDNANEAIYLITKAQGKTK